MDKKQFSLKQIRIKVNMLFNPFNFTQKQESESPVKDTTYFSSTKMDASLLSPSQI